jgi:hypothetical protein
MNATEIVDSLLNMTVSDFNAYRIEKKTAGTEMEPYVHEFEM